MTISPPRVQSSSEGTRVTIEPVDTRRREQVRAFVDFPYRRYAGHPLWVPPLRMDVALQLNREKYPYYRHSDADFFLARRERTVVGRIAVLENPRYNHTHAVRTAQFNLFECEDYIATAEA